MISQSNCFFLDCLFFLVAPAIWSLSFLSLGFSMMYLYMGFSLSFLGFAVLLGYGNGHFFLVKFWKIFSYFSPNTVSTTFCSFFLSPSWLLNYTAFSPFSVSLSLFDAFCIFFKLFFPSLFFQASHSIHWSYLTLFNLISIVIIFIFASFIWFCFKYSWPFFV